MRLFPTTGPSLPAHLPYLCDKSHEVNVVKLNGPASTTKPSGPRSAPACSAAARHAATSLRRNGATAVAKDSRLPLRRTCDDAVLAALHTANASRKSVGSMPSR